MEEISKHIIENISNLRPLVAKFSKFQSAEITLERIVYFLSQFTSRREVEIMLKLLAQVDFIDHDRMIYLLNSAYSRIPNSLKQHAVISSLGTIQDSSSMICYGLLKTIFNEESDALQRIIEPNSIGAYLSQHTPSALIFFDDNITSGTQLSGFFEELLIGSSKPELVPAPLSDAQKITLQHVPIRICYAVQLSEQSNKEIEKIKNKFNLDLEIFCGKVDFNNYVDFQSPTMASEEEAEFAKQFISAVSKSLYEDKEWDQDKLYHRLIGYGNLGKLTVFYYNAPKSFLPVFWKFGIYKRQDWIPLFPEIQEKKKMIEKEVEMNHVKLDGIRSWISQSSKQRQPNISVGFYNNDGELSSVTTVYFPSTEFIEKNILKYFNLVQINPEPNIVVPRSHEYQRLLEEHFGQPAPDDIYARYIKGVEYYNHQVQVYEREVIDYITKKIWTASISVQILNDGDLPASNLRLKLFSDSNEFLLDQLRDLEEPSFEQQVPQLDDYVGGIARGRFSMPKLELLNMYQKRPINPGSTYVSRFEYAKIGHNDAKEIKIEITRINRSASSIQIPFELNFDEFAETIIEELKINFEFVESMDENSKASIIKELRNFKIE